jgi:hypothetical protein
MLQTFIDLFRSVGGPPILFGKLGRLFDSFIAQSRQEMRGCLRRSTSTLAMQKPSSLFDGRRTWRLALRYVTPNLVQRGRLYAVQQVVGYQGYTGRDTQCQTHDQFLARIAWSEDGCCPRPEESAGRTAENFAVTRVPGEVRIKPQLSRTDDR